MGQWYVRVRGQKPLGPVTTEQLTAGIGAGQVPVDVAVCRVGGSEWSPLGGHPSSGRRETSRRRSRRTPQLEAAGLPNPTPQTAAVPQRDRALPRLPPPRRSDDS